MSLILQTFQRYSLKLAKVHNLKAHENISQRGLETLPIVIEKFKSEKPIDESGFDQIHFLEEKIKMEIVLYARYLRNVHMF